jgi:hypothetical protein
VAAAKFFRDKESMTVVVGWSVGGMSDSGKQRKRKSRHIEFGWVSV